MNEELMKEIKALIPWLIAAGIVVGGYYGWKNYSAAKKAAASEAVVRAYTAEELEEAVAKHGGSDAAGVLKLRLAKKSYDDGNYQQALDIYEKFAKDKPEGFGEIPVVGRAACLEAMGKVAEAQKAYADFAAASPKSPFALTARLGVARTYALAGDKAKALAEIAAIRKDATDRAVKARVDAAEDFVKRYVKPAPAKAAPAPAKAAPTPAKAAPAKPAK